MQSTEVHRVQLCWPQAGFFLLGLSFPICDMGLSAWTRRTVRALPLVLLAGVVWCCWGAGVGEA